jgi:hypothetical protein
MKEATNLAAYSSLISIARPHSTSGMIRRRGADWVQKVAAQVCSLFSICFRNVNEYKYSN